MQRSLHSHDRGMRATSLVAAFLTMMAAGGSGWAQLARPGAQAAGIAPTGTVSGYVTCSDTRLPARIASVVLQPVVTPDVAGVPVGAGSATQTSIVQTMMDGSFTISKVAPGDYYLVAELPGYISPLSVFSRDELNHPTKQMFDLMATLLTPISVTPNGTTRANVSLIKGATITGAVRYEDGSADEGSRVQLMRKNARGAMAAYAPITLTSERTTTDDQGRFHFAGLPPGEYTLNTVLAVGSMEVTGDVTAMHVGMNYKPTGPSWLTIYFGNVFRQTDSKRITVAGAETVGGQDIVIELSKMHSVSGTVLDQSTGAAVNQARVQIVLPGGAVGDTPIGKTDVGEDGTFRFPFVPEGTYMLVVSGARQVTHDQVPMDMTKLPPGMKFFFVDGSDGSTPMTSVDKIQREYATVKQPIIVHSDMTDVQVPLSARDPGSKAPKAKAKQ